MKKNIIRYNYGICSTLVCFVLTPYVHKIPEKFWEYLPFFGCMEDDLSREYQRELKHRQDIL